MYAFLALQWRKTIQRPSRIYIIPLHLSYPLYASLLHFIRSFPSQLIGIWRRLFPRWSIAQIKRRLEQLANVGNSIGDIQAVFPLVERDVVSLYGSSSELSRLGSEFLRQIRPLLQGNPNLVGYVADRYLAIHKSACFLHFEGSEKRRRAINDLLTLIFSPDLPVSDHVAKDIRDFFSLVQDDLRRRPYPLGYAVSTRWKTIVDRAMRVATHLHDPRHIAYVGTVLFDVDTAILPEDVRREILHRRLESYERPYPELRGIGDTPLALPGTTVDVDGVPHTQRIEQAFSYYHEIKSGLPAGQASGTVLEAGSGCGRLARILHLLGHAKCYVLVDLPESLLFAYAFLRINLPDARTLVLKAPADIKPGITEDYDFVFCPIQLLEKLRFENCDLFINTYSFSEMTQGCVDHILDCVHKYIRPRFLFSMNMMFSDKSVHFDTGGLDGEENDAVLNLKPEWWPRSFELAHTLLDGKSRVIGSVVLERTKTLPPAELIEKLVSAAKAVGSDSPLRLGYMYFAALWSIDSAITSSFFAALRRFFFDRGIIESDGYSFDRIGEVKFLRKRHNGTD